MTPNHLINLPEATYNSLQKIATENNLTVNQVIDDLAKYKTRTVDLAIGLDTFPSLSNNHSELIKR